AARCPAARPRSIASASPPPLDHLVEFGGRSSDRSTLGTVQQGSGSRIDSRYGISPLALRELTETGALAVHMRRAKRRTLDVVRLRRRRPGAACARLLVGRCRTGHSARARQSTFASRLRSWIYLGVV